MGFDAMLEKVRQAESALQAQGRRTAADARQVRSAWRAFWSPARIVLAGLLSGFVAGRSELPKKATSSGALQLINLVSGLIASSNAKAAAEDASEAAEAVESAEPRAPEATPGASTPAGSQPRRAASYEAPETFRDSGQL